MAGVHPLIQVQNTLSSLSAPYVHGLVHPHQHMHRHTPQHAFTPRLLQSSTNTPILPTIMEAQDSKSYYSRPRGATGASFTPVTTFHRAAQKPFRTKQGRWGALHVCIAWKIYYHKLKKMQQNPNSRHGAPSPEYPSALSLSDSETQLQPEQPSSMHPNPDSLCGQSTHRNTGERSETAGKTSEPSTPPPASCCSHDNKREEGERLDEGEKHGDPQTDAAQDSPLRNKPWDKTVTPERDGRHDGSLDRKRQLDCDGFIKVKRVKQEIIDDQLDSSKASLTDLSSFSTAHVHPSSCTAPHINISGQLSVLYPDTSRYHAPSTPAPGGFISYPGAEMYPYLTAPWEPAWFVHRSKDLHSRQNDYSLNACKGIRIPLAAQRQREAFHGVCVQPFHFPLASRRQETAYLRGKELLHSRHENCHPHHCGQYLPHAGLLAASYLGP